MFWVLKRTVSLRRFFLVLTTYVLVEKYENWYFGTLPDCQRKFRLDFCHVTLILHIQFLRHIKLINITAFLIYVIELALYLISIIFFSSY